MSNMCDRISTNLSTWNEINISFFYSIRLAIRHDERRLHGIFVTFVSVLNTAFEKSNDMY